MAWSPELQKEERQAGLEGGKATDVSELWSFSEWNRAGTLEQWLGQWPPGSCFQVVEHPGHQHALAQGRDRDGAPQGETPPGCSPRKEKVGPQRSQSVGCVPPLPLLVWLLLTLLGAICMRGSLRGRDGPGLEVTGHREGR